MVATVLLTCPTASAQVERVWLTHRTHDPSKLVVNWTTKTPGDSVVWFGRTAAYGREVHVPGRRTLHHVEIPLAERGVVYHYAVRTGEQTAPDATVQAYPADVLRVAVVANWQRRPDLTALRKDEPHLLLTAGDNIPDLWSTCGVGVTDCVTPYAALVDAYPGLFRSVPVLPALGNHDREIRPRGKAPPPDPVYDINATAFRTFFPLPGDGGTWHFDVPAFRVRFIALDLSHAADRGTTWQTCPDFGPGSAQYRWYRGLMEARPPGFVVTLYNERNATVRGLAKGAWRDLLRRGTVTIAGFGYFAERAEADGVPYLNTSLSGRGDRYPDPASKFLTSADNYVLLTVDRAGGTLTVALKSLEGAVLDRTTLRAGEKRPGGEPKP